jgi:hypothetical protein
VLPSLLHPAVMLTLTLALCALPLLATFPLRVQVGCLRCMCGTSGLTVVLW